VSVSSSIAVSTARTVNRCLSCGTTENMGKRRYCSVDCRQRLRQKLNARTGLLRALNARYATFYFTDLLIILHVMPYGAREIFSYVLRRSNGRTPADDFCHLSDILGNAWWSERHRTNRKYLASQFLLDKASRNAVSAASVQPIELKKPSINQASLIRLKLGKADLDSPDVERLIKSAYRLQVKKHHPDLGGDADSFRRLHEAYEELVRWADNPSFISRRGFPDKWFYDGRKNRWVQPTPLQTE